MDNAESVAFARRIVEKHVSNDPTSSWGSCRECRQHYWGASEAQPMWPCDARRLADMVLHNDGCREPQVGGDSVGS